MTNRILYQSESIPEQACILVVDIQHKQIESELDMEFMDGGTEKEEQEQVIYERLDKMKEELKRLEEQGYPIYFIADDSGIIEEFEDEIPHTLLPEWQVGYDSEKSECILNPILIEEMKKHKEVYVCGLWKERCVYIVTKLLKQEGIHSILSSNPVLTLEEQLVVLDTDDSVEAVAKRDGVELQTL